MPLTKPIPRARPVTSTAPTSPRTEDTQGYRRGRAIRSCLECRRRKMRCNRSRPCQNCNRFCRECVYLPYPEWPSGASNNVKVDSNFQSPTQGSGRAYPPADSSQTYGYAQPSSFTNRDYNGDSDTLAKHGRSYETDLDDDVLDVALQVGRLTISEKVGGYFRPHVASQIATLLSRANTIDPFNLQTHFSVPANQRLTHRAAPSSLAPVKKILPLEPSPGFLTTAPRPYLPQPGSELPTRNELNLLYSQYWLAVDPLAHIIHRPSFETECRKYWLNGQVTDAAPASFKALLLAMCLAAAVSLPPVQAKEVSGVSLQTLVGRLKMATEKALTDADCMSSPNIQALQAFTIYLIPQCRAEISRSHTVFIEVLLRLAMSAGLNRDPNGLGMDPIECQVRRLLWHQICFLDLLTAEAQGPDSAVRDDQFNTSLPLNIRDDALGRQQNHETVPMPFWTDATFSILRYECCMVHRFIAGQRSAIDLGQTDLKTAQHLVNAHKTRIERQYLQYLDENIPIQRCAKLVGQIFTARFDTILLHKHSQFDMNTELQIDDRKELIQTCLTICESAILLDTDPDLAAWAWYSRAFHQYERSIFLLMEIYRDPVSPYADRINRVLDHVFGVAAHMSSGERSRDLLQLLVEQFDKLMQLRKVKIPQLAVSDNESSSPNDHSGTVSTPEDGQWNQWQPPEPMYGHGYGRDLPPVSDSMWWPIPVQHGMLCGSTVPQHDDYGYGMGLGPA